MILKRLLLENFPRNGAWFEDSEEEKAAAKKIGLNENNPAIRGLNSNWINEKIIASQRLSDRLINEFDIIEQFKELNLKAVFNLQEPGEHPNWGDGIVDMKVGFSYTPENLQKAGISYYNFHWEDWTNPNMSEVMKNVKLMDMHISKGEAILTHWHAGQGRTGVVIAAYLMYSNTTETVDETVEYIRSKRTQWLKKGYNRKFLHHIKSKFDENRQMFPTEKRPIKLTLKDIIKKQEVMFHGDERIKQKHIPKVMDVCLVSI